jgi:hypothetical protein
MAWPFKKRDSAPKIIVVSFIERDGSKWYDHTHRFGCQTCGHRWDGQPHSYVTCPRCQECVSADVVFAEYRKRRGAPLPESERAAEKEGTNR